MFINHLPPQEEQFDKAYVDKATCRSVQVWPVPEDLENWYVIDFDPAFKYSGKYYVPESDSWEEVQESLEDYNARMLKLRKEAYAETDALFMEWQYEQTPESEEAWRNAVAQVKKDYPFK
jgi:hypothetical protein